MKSAIYEGVIRHRRFHPFTHEFQYGIFFMYIDLAEKDTLFRDAALWSADRLNLAWWRRRDYIRPTDIPVDLAVRNLVQERTGTRPDGPVRMLTHLRYFGLCFNPVTFYYCFDKDDSCLTHVVADVNNTPWNERNQYVLVSTGQDSPVHEYHPAKEFHVSPFMPMDMTYRWLVRDPDDQVMVHIENHREEVKWFEASLNLTRREISTASLNQMLMRYPVMSLRVHGGIYWQAFRLWRKGASFYSHP